MRMKACFGLIMTLIAMAAVSGCSKGNDDSAIVDSSGKHVAGWFDPATGGRHPGSYLSSPAPCVQCHGSDLKGGISGVSCFSASFAGGACHPQGPDIHPAGFASPAVHGARAKGAPAGVIGMAFCQSCHGAAYSGGKTPSGLTSASCTGCHGVSAPHPAKPWRGSGSTHADSSPANAAACAQCHTRGQNLSTPRLSTYASGEPGCFNATLCHGLTGHSDTTVFPAPWSSPTNHGAFARTDPTAGGTKGFGYCQTCHGTTFAGGGGQSCFPCHGVSAPHPKRTDSTPGWTLASGTLSHVNTGLGNAPICAACHNATTKNLGTAPVNYAARFVPAGSFTNAAPDCFNGSLCHSDVRKTSNCTACHGPLSATGFNSLGGSVDPADPGAGAHIAHLNASVRPNPMSVNIACGECHTVPAAPVQAGAHRNGTVDMAFGPLSRTGGASPVVTRDAGTGAVVCSNTYCHGATLAGGGTNKTPRWNHTTYIAGAASNGCGLCHGFPPATSIHDGKTPNLCITCHPHVNGAGTGFTDPSRHVDGTVTVSITAPHPAAFPGSSHLGATNGAGCLGCHSMGTGPGDSPYPASAGVPPNCRSCHLAANPTADPNCADCHGIDDTGRPVTGLVSDQNPANFPNRRGNHTRIAHTGPCTTCHTFTAGDPRHGWSGRVRSTGAAVIPAVNWNPSAKTCTDVSCHGGAGSGSENWYSP